MACDNIKYMEQETRICQNCKSSFQIDALDFEFYKKMKVPSFAKGSGMAMPAPTWCPECRLRRRMVFKNIRTFYKRKCDLCSKEIISVYPSGVSFPVFCQACWWSDKWNALDYGKEYDFSKTFFEQHKELFSRVPKMSLSTDYLRVINSEYTNYAGPLKNCYLVFQAEEDENCMYSAVILFSKDSIDCSNVARVENSYELFNCQNCYKIYFSTECVDCMDIYFSKNLRNCTNCFGCNNLRHKNYCIFNKDVPKEEYFNFIGKINLGSFSEVQKYKKEADLFWSKFPSSYFHGTHNNNVTGDYIANSKNVSNSFEVSGGEDLKYCFQAYMPITKDCYDYGDWGNNVSLGYESINCGENVTNFRFCYSSWIGGNWEYCDTVFSSNYMFGCISIRKGEYCILNKKYTKEEYEELVSKIIKQMG